MRSEPLKHPGSEGILPRAGSEGFQPRAGSEGILPRAGSEGILPSTRAGSPRSQACCMQARASPLRVFPAWAATLTRREHAGKEGILPSEGWKPSLPALVPPRHSFRADVSGGCGSHA